MQLKLKSTFRDYDNAPPNVRKLYKGQRTHQCLCYVKRQHNALRTGRRFRSLWEAIKSLEGIVDRSDPDVTLPNYQHAFQTAEGLRQADAPKWMQLTGLLHDVGKVLYLDGNDIDGTSIETQWGVVGDTFPVGYPRSGCLIYPEYNTLLNCDCEMSTVTPSGFGSCLFSWGHDEYLYLVLLCNSYKREGVPSERELPLDVRKMLYVIRYHSFHAWHDREAYSELADARDWEMLPVLREFAQHDLYTKSDVDLQDADALKPYYDGLCRSILGFGLDGEIDWL